MSVGKIQMLDGLVSTHCNFIDLFSATIFRLNVVYKGFFRLFQMLLGLQPTAELSARTDHRPGRDELLQPVAESVSPADPEESQQVGEQERPAPGEEVIKLFGDVIYKI
jgi:hypothetical protein